MGSFFYIEIYEIIRESVGLLCEIKVDITDHTNRFRLYWLKLTTLIKNPASFLE